MLQRFFSLAFTTRLASLDSRCVWMLFYRKCFSLSINEFLRLSNKYNFSNKKIKRKLCFSRKHRVHFNEFSFTIGRWRRSLRILSYSPLAQTSFAFFLFKFHYFSHVKIYPKLINKFITVFAGRLLNWISNSRRAQNEWRREKKLSIQKRSSRRTPK